jgi:CubicO group peptidase (beta-lactamase class C family)
MAAVAVKDGLLTLDERASDTLTEWRSDPEKAKITLRELLSMTSGQPPRSQKFMGYMDSVNAPLTAPPGTKFQYGPAPLQIFGEIMRRKLARAGEDSNARGYIERRILSPLGVRVGSWRNGPDGNPLMPEGLALSAREWAKIGEFVRAGGRHDGKQLVDPVAFAALFKGSAVNPAYGLTWWLPHASTAGGPTTENTDIALRAGDLPSDMVIAGGAGRQRLYVIPSLKLTIVRQARFDIKAARAGIRAKSTWSDAHFVLLVTKGVTAASGRAGS